MHAKNPPTGWRKGERIGGINTLHCGVFTPAVSLCFSLSFWCVLLPLWQIKIEKINVHMYHMTLAGSLVSVSTLLATWANERAPSLLAPVTNLEVCYEWSRMCSLLLCLFPPQYFKTKSCKKCHHCLTPCDRESITNTQRDKVSRSDRKQGREEWRPHLSLLVQLCMNPDLTFNVPVTRGNAFLFGFFVHLFRAD